MKELVNPIKQMKGNKNTNLINFFAWWRKRFKNWWSARFYAFHFRFYIPFIQYFFFL